MSVVVPTVATAAAILLTVTIEDPWRLLAASLFIAVLTSPAGNVPGRVRLITIWTLPFAVPLLIIHGLLNPAFTATSFVGVIPVRASGMAYAAMITSRLYLIAAAAAAWQAIPRVQLIALAQALRLPDSVTVMIASAASATAVVERRIHNVLLAQQARGLTTRPGVSRRVRALISVGLPVVTTTIVDAHHRGAMVATRGFGFVQMAPIALKTMDRGDLTRIVVIGITSVLLLFSQ